MEDNENKRRRSSKGMRICMILGVAIGISLGIFLTFARVLKPVERKWKPRSANTENASPQESKTPTYVGKNVEIVGRGSEAEELAEEDVSAGDISAEEPEDFGESVSTGEPESWEETEVSEETVSSEGETEVSEETVSSEEEAVEVETVYRFRNNKLLTEHFEKHGGDFSYATKEEYEAGANAVIHSPEALHKTEAEDGDDVYYLEASNEFVIVSTDGYIRTYFKPSAGIAYYNRQ